MIMCTSITKHNLHLVVFGLSINISRFQINAQWPLQWSNIASIFSKAYGCWLLNFTDTDHLYLLSPVAWVPERSNAFVLTNSNHLYILLRLYNITLVLVFRWDSSSFYDPINGLVCSMFNCEFTTCRNSAKSEAFICLSLLKSKHWLLFLATVSCSPSISLFFVYSILNFILIVETLSKL